MAIKAEREREREREKARQLLSQYAACLFRLLGLRVINVYDVDNKTYLIKLAKLVS